jgi:alpha-mannosidase
MSFVEVDGDTVIGTVVKRAEDDPKGLVVRLFEADGKPANATVKAPASLATNRRVNFVEDALTAPAKGSEVSLSLRGYEIVNLMFAPAAGRKERSK